MNWAVIASLIETCNLNAVDPHAWLVTTLTAIAGGRMQSDVADLVPGNYAAKVGSERRLPLIILR